MLIPLRRARETNLARRIVRQRTRSLWTGCPPAGFLPDSRPKQGRGSPPGLFLCFAFRDPGFGDQRRRVAPRPGALMGLYDGTRVFPMGNAAESLWSRRRVGTFVSRFREGLFAKSSPCCPHRLVWSRTPAFHAGDTGSNPVGDTTLRTDGASLARAVRRRQARPDKIGAGRHRSNRDTAPDGPRQVAVARLQKVVPSHGLPADGNNRGHFGARDLGGTRAFRIGDHA